MNLFEIIATGWGILTIPYMSYTIHDYGMKRLANYWRIHIDAQQLYSDVFDMIEEYKNLSKEKDENGKKKIDLEYKNRAKLKVGKFRSVWEPFCDDSCLKKEYHSFIKEIEEHSLTSQNGDFMRWAWNHNTILKLRSLINKSEKVKDHLLSNKDLFWCFPPQLIEKMNEKFDYRDKSKFP